MRSLLDQLVLTPGIRIYNKESYRDHQEQLRHSDAINLFTPLITALYGKITEIVGLPGVGKSTLMMQAAMDLVLANPAFKVIYVDTRSNASLLRFRQLVGLKTGTLELYHLERILRRFIYVQLTMVEEFEKFVEKTVWKWAEDDSVAMLIIDDIPTIFKSLHPSTSISDKIHRISIVGATLSRLALFHHIAIITINQQVIKVTGSRQQNRFLCPSMGQTWEQFVAKRYFMFSWKSQLWISEKLQHWTNETSGFVPFIISVIFTLF